LPDYVSLQAETYFIVEDKQNKRMYRERYDGYLDVTPKEVFFLMLNRFAWYIWNDDPDLQYRQLVQEALIAKWKEEK
jgi:hypothetical protein